MCHEERSRSNRYSHHYWDGVIGVGQTKRWRMGVNKFCAVCTTYYYCFLTQRVSVICKWVRPWSRGWEKCMCELWGRSYSQVSSSYFRDQRLHCPLVVGTCALTDQFDSPKIEQTQNTHQLVPVFRSSPPSNLVTSFCLSFWLRLLPYRISPLVLDRLVIIDPYIHTHYCPFSIPTCHGGKYTGVSGVHYIWFLRAKWARIIDRKVAITLWSNVMNKLVSCP